MFCVTFTVAGLVQLFEGFVTVTVYVPGAFTVGEALLPPETIPGPAQLKVAPPVDEEPVITLVVFVQVRTCAAPAFALGKAGAV